MLSERTTTDIRHTHDRPTCRNTRRPITTVAPYLESAARGDPAAWEALVHHFSGVVSAVTWSYRLNAADSADVAQALWLSLFEHIDQIRNPEALGGWIQSVTQRLCLRHQKRAGREVLLVDLGADLPAPVDSVDAGLLRAERRATVKRAIGSLPPRQQELMTVLTQEPAPSYEQVSSTLGMPIGSIGPTRQRSIERLRDNAELAAL